MVALRRTRRSRLPSRRRVRHRVTTPRPSSATPASGEKAREIVSRRSDPHRVVGGLDAHHDSAEANQQRDDRAGPGPRAQVGESSKRESGQEGEAADEVVTCRRARLRLEERVVDHMKGDHAGCGQETQSLSPRGGAPRSDRRGGGLPEMQRLSHRPKLTSRPATVQGQGDNRTTRAGMADPPAAG